MHPWPPLRPAWLKNDIYLPSLGKKQNKSKSRRDPCPVHPLGSSTVSERIARSLTCIRTYYRFRLSRVLTLHGISLTTDRCRRHGQRVSTQNTKYNTIIYSIIYIDLYIYIYIFIRYSRTYEQTVQVDAYVSCASPCGIALRVAPLET